MKLVIACDSFKGSCSAAEAVERISAGVRRIYPDAEIVELPVADGGEGTVDAFLRAVGGRKVETVVTGPLGQPARADFGLLDSGTAVIEMAAASGIMLMPEDRLNPMDTTTYGTGELIREALDRGCREIIIGIGGSATNDGGAGMAQALGVKFFDGEGCELTRENCGLVAENRESERGCVPCYMTGRALSRLARIDISGLDSRLAKTKIIVACDVKNPLCGPEGASAVYGPQKGATPEMVESLDRNLEKYALIAAEKLHRDIRNVPGAGAAGGLGAGLMLFCGGEIRPGIHILLDMAKFEEKVKQADLVITGEGRVDGQSVFGKVPTGVAERTKARADIPVFAITGSIGPGAEAVYEHGIDAVVSIAPGPVSLEDAMRNCGQLLENGAERLMRVVRSVR